MKWEIFHAPPLLRTVFVVGVEDRPNGTTRIYIGQRGRRQYVLLDPEGTEAVRRAWGGGGHVCIQPAALAGRPIFYDRAAALP